MNKVFDLYLLIPSNIWVVTRRVGQKAKRFVFFVFFWVASWILCWLNTLRSIGIPVVNMDLMNSRDGSGTSVVDSIISTRCCLKDLDWRSNWGLRIFLMIFWLRKALPSRTCRSSSDSFFYAKLSLRFIERGAKHLANSCRDLQIIVNNFL